MQDRRHRDEPEIPTTLAERKEWIDWLYHHPIFRQPITLNGSLSFFDNWDKCVYIRPAWVNPETRYVEKDTRLNTQFEVWIEGGPMYDQSGDFPSPEGGWNEDNRWSSTHDIRLDCGSPNFEDALLLFAARIKCHYDDDGTDKDLWWCFWKDDSKKCTGNPDTFCPDCGFKIDDPTIDDAEDLMRRIRESEADLQAGRVLSHLEVLSALEFDEDEG